MFYGYPLDWPKGRSRTLRHKQARFQLSFTEACNHLGEELRLMGARSVKLTTNVPLGSRGRPIASSNHGIADTGACVLFARGSRQYAMACDRWDDVTDNIRALGLSIAALRGLERWGGSEMIDYAFAGFQAALPPSSEDWRSVLGTDITSFAAAKARYRHLASEAHPDRGGTTAIMQRLNNAFEEAQRELGER